MINFKKQEVIPILLGVDMSAYGVARSFHEKYGIFSLVLGEEYFFHTMNTKILKLRIIDNLQDEEVLFNELLKIKDEFKNKKLFLIATTEVYAEPIINKKEELDEYFIIPSINKEMLLDLVRKDRFHDLCKKYDIPTPLTLIVTKDNYKDINYDFIFGYPMVIKPNNSRTYFRTNFEGKKKAYIIDTKEEAIDVIKEIYEKSNYKDELILQEFIPGDDDGMRLISTYSDSNGKMKNMTLSHVYLEDHNPSLVGNPTVHVVELDKELALKFRNLLDSLNYIGYANIDLKYDPRDNKTKAFDFNTRLGRSSYHLTASGLNIAEMIMDDYIYNKEIPLIFNENEYLWTAVPISIIYKYVSNPKLIKIAKDLINKKRYSRTLFYNKDMNIIRRLRLYRMDKAYFENYKKNYIKR